MRVPDGRTRLYGIFGHPVAHSLSPIMQNGALQEAKINACYLPFHVLPDRLESAVEALRALNIGGVNVTLPHKQQVMTYLDRIDEDAALIGAVNTIVNREGVLAGYNTDGIGFLRSLKEDLGFEPRGKRVTIFGAGGACRAAVVALLRAGVDHLVLVNRDIGKAKALIESLGAIVAGRQVNVVSAGSGLFFDALERSDLIVNSTSIGLKGEPFELCPLGKIKASASVYDMVYSTAETPLVSAARQQGLASADGIGMLAGQGEEAFALWFDQQPRKGLMKDILLQLRAPQKS